MSRLPLIFAVLLLSCAASFSQSSDASNVTVNVKDPSGAGIKHVLIQIRADSLSDIRPEAFAVELRTNDRGIATSRVPAGVLDVFVSATGFTPQCEKIRVRDGVPITRDFALKIDKTWEEDHGESSEGVAVPLQQ